MKNYEEPSNVPVKESREEALRRLPAKRLERCLDELRLLRQLASPNYNYSSREAEQLITRVAVALTQAAQAFDIEFSAQVNGGAFFTTRVPEGFEPVRRELPAVNNDDLAVVLRALETGHVDDAVAVLLGALQSEPRSIREVLAPGNTWSFAPMRAWRRSS